MQQTVENIKKQNRESAENNIVIYLDKHRVRLEEQTNQEIAKEILDGVQEFHPEVYASIIA